MESSTYARDACTAYAESIVSGEKPSGKWIYAAAKRYLSDLQRTDLEMDWDEVGRIDEFFARLPLIGAHSSNKFRLSPWQLWALSNIWGWRWLDGRRRISTAMLQVARGNGKTTLMAGLALYDLCSGNGRRVHCIANRREQAEILLDTARVMAPHAAGDIKCLQYTIAREESDSWFSTLPAKKTSLDGLTPSLWIADEAAEYRDNFLEKLESSLPKRLDSLGIIISTPSDNPENVYGERIQRGEAVLREEESDDSSVYMLYGIDETDDVADEECWQKANPGLEYGQPDIRAIRDAWKRSKATAVGRASFTRYHCCRATAEGGGWLDMEFLPKPCAIEWETMKHRAAWAALDLSKSLDLTAFVICIPLDDGRVAIRGKYWWPSEGIAKREMTYRLPIRNWAAKGHVCLAPGSSVRYEDVRAELKAAAQQFNLQKIAFDPWGSKYFAEQCLNDKLPLAEYRQTIANVGPGCQLWQSFWVERKLIFPDDPVLATACRQAIAVRDHNGNIRLDKRRKAAIIDPLASAVMALHAWGGETRSAYEDMV